MSFCPSCSNSKCPQCCKKSQCGRSRTGFLAKVEKTGCESKGGFHSERGLQPTIQNETTPHQVTCDPERLFKPGQNWFLKEALLALIQKLVVEKVVAQSSLAFYNWLFLVPKPNNKWRPILDLSQLNLYLSPSTFKMETPEIIWLSLQKGKWVTLLDFSDAYFHIPIIQRSRKYLRFFLNKQTY